MAQLTPEEIEFIEAMIAQQQEQQAFDPFDYAAGQYGQGSDYLGMKKTPVAWDRMADKDDLLGDMLKRTGLYFDDIVDLPHQRYEDPGNYEGYTSDVYGLYAGNAAYEAVRALTDSGIPFEVALQQVADSAAVDPEIAASLPRNRNEGVEGYQTPTGNRNSPEEAAAIGVPESYDFDAFRSGAETFLTEGAREDREFGEWDARNQQYEDYIRARNGEDFFPTTHEFTPRPEAAPRQQFGPNEARPDGFFLPNVGGKAGPQRPQQPTQVPRNEARGSVPSVQSTLSRSRAEGQIDAGRSGRVVRTNVDRSPTRNPAGGRRVERPGKRDTKGRTGSDVAYAQNKIYNDTAQRTAASLQRQKANMQVMSKEDENNARLIQAFNLYMYGGNV